ncbi:hypothetical protein A9Q99_14265 [Gammaproteobacteria bacterium 45_16_T64]|nr:hypothetical protein A9Q99_14265 [Gammaproteobacteria bacterium 45_16_T64]
MSFIQPIAPDIDEGIDRKTLKTLKQRFLQVNNGRLDRMLSTLSIRHQQFVQALPLLLHLNHPSLPGYITGATPCGIKNFNPEQSHLRAARGLARSFHYRKSRSVLREILGIYLMGSTGTIAHSDKSDMDFWVCYQPGLNSSALRELRQKLDAITRWAEEIHLEVYFFLMEPNQFKSGQRSGLSGEDCGSAQHYLLLDEFYRTSLIIAGNLPLWWMVPSYEEKQYERYSNTLLDKRFIPRDDYIDFGGISDFPAGEFVGAGMWQLYKGIDSPYKSVLKIALTEVYASSYPNIECLSLRYKRAIYTGNLDLNELDPYIMVYRAIESHLVAREEFRRLELIRHCFYFKVNEQLTRKSDTKRQNWRRAVVQSLANEWGWDEGYLKQLDNRKHWKILRVRAERQELVQELNYSYRFLSTFARDNNIEASIKQEEMNILGRKLYAAFERKGGKIELINPGIASNLTEDHLSFHFIEDDKQPGVSDYWAVFRGYLKIVDAAGHSPIKKSRGLLELVAWCYFNKLIDQSTRFSVDQSAEGCDLTDGELNQTVQGLSRLFPNFAPKAQQEAFEHAAYPTQISLFINVGIDPMGTMTRQGIHRLSNQTNALNYSALHHNLVLSVDQIVFNSWGEIICSHFSGDNSLIDCLVNYMRQIPPDGSIPLPKLEVKSYCKNRAIPIALRVEELFNDVIHCYYSGTRSTQTRYLVEIEQYIYMLQFRRNSPQIRALKDYDQLVDALSEPQSTYSHIVVDEHGLNRHPLRVISRIGNPSKIQVFYQRIEDKVDLYVHDEVGSLFYTQEPFYDENILLNHIDLFLQAIQYRSSIANDEEAVRQMVSFYEIVPNKKKELTAVRKHINSTSTPTRYFNVQAIGELTGLEDTFYTIYCDNLEFSQFEHGDQLFVEVAKHIASKRKAGSRYPCYLTDLDLSLLTLDGSAPEQTVEYFKRKKEIESALNSALNALA